MNDHPRKSITILIADDDADDRLLIEDAFVESHLKNAIHFVEDGEELMDYLHRRRDYAHLAGVDLPGLILLDLNMPRKDGREALKEIKADETLKRIPIIILTTSKAEEDIYRTYDLGVNSYITKPVSFDSMVEVVQTLGVYWFEIVSLPKEEQGGACERVLHKHPVG